MDLSQIPQRFEGLGREGLVYRIAPGASPGALAAAESRLGLALPPQVRQFYSAFYGIEIVDPPFKLYAIADANLQGPLLEFCVCGHVHRLAFDTSSINAAGQWFIVNAATRYRITYTMASLWSIRMWSWIEKRRPIWYDVHDESAGE